MVSRHNINEYGDNTFRSEDPHEVKMTPTITGGWVNEMKSGEYNPVHFQSL